MRFAALLLVSAALACGGDSGTTPTTDPGDTGGSGGGGGTGGIPDGRRIIDDPSFSTTIQEVFERTGCTASGCHGAGASAGLDLRSSAAYDELVGVRSVQRNSRFLVEAGDAQNSWLVIKIEGRQDFGQTMPIGGPPLDSIDVTNIRNWIDNGAANN